LTLKKSTCRERASMPSLPLNHSEPSSSLWRQSSAFTLWKTWWEERTPQIWRKHE
jgi:hypothetical protein